MGCAPRARMSQSPDDSDERVEALLALVLERLTAGHDNALESVCAEHPEHAADLRERLASLRAMNLVPEGAAAMAFPERLGEFRLLRRLGGGGMGVVFEALQEPLGRRVALKLIRPEHLYFEHSRERFRRETEAVARLSHPGVVAIHTVGEARGTPYFAMEMIRGASVAEALEQVRGLAPEGLLGADLHAAVLACIEPGEAVARAELDELYRGTWIEACVRIALAMCDALEHAHARGVLHRDIKPSNIALTPEGRVVLLDFGLAGLDDELRMTRSGSALGSVLYMAPEQLEGRLDEIDARTDVYALGVTLYEMLSLQPPYAAADSQQTRAAILDGQPPALRSRHPGVPRDLELVCLHALDRDRARRYASMAAFGADLRNVLEGRPISVRPPSSLYRARRWVARHPTLSATAGLSALLVTVLPTALYLQQRANNTRLETLLEEVSRAEGRAQEESRRARAAAAEAEQSAKFLVELFAASDPYATGGRELTAEAMLQSGLARVDAELADRPELQARLLERIGVSYTNLEHYAQSIEPLERALALRRELHGDDDPRTAEARVWLGSALRLAGDARCTEQLRTALDVFSRHPPEEPAARINAQTLLALSLLDEGASDEPLALLMDAREQLENLASEDRGMHWMVSTSLVNAHLRLGQPAQAEALARALLNDEREASGPLGFWRVTAMNRLAGALRAQGRLDEALAAYEEQLPQAEQVYGAGSPALATMVVDYAETLFESRRFERACELLEPALRDLVERLGAEHTHTQRVLRSLVDAALRARRPQLALEQLIPRIQELEGQDSEAPELSYWRYRLALAELALGECGSAQRTLEACTPEQIDPSPLARQAWELALARTLSWSSATRPRARELALRWIDSGAPNMAAVARALAARVAWLDGEREQAREHARALDASQPDDAWDLWPRLEAQVLLAEFARADSPSADRASSVEAQLERALRELASELGAQHCDLRGLREHLARR